MTCNHNCISSPTTVSLCLENQEIECCPDEYETMIVCGLCGAYKIVSVESVCDECCGNDIHIWDNVLNTWNAADGSDGWTTSHIGFDLTNYSIYQEAFEEAQNSSISRANFMVKGYHYVEPTTPIRTDSCKLYIDTSIETEESNVENEIWEPPSTAFLDINKTSLLHLKGIHGFYFQT